MLIAEPGGRERLLDAMRSMLPNAGQRFTLRDAVDVFEESCNSHKIENTTEYVLFNSRVEGRLRSRILVVELARCLGWEIDWVRPPGIISAALRIHGGFRSYLTPTFILGCDEEAPPTSQTLETLRNSRLFKAFADAEPIESCLTLWGGEEFFDLCETMMPALVDGGLFEGCDDETMSALRRTFPANE